MHANGKINECVWEENQNMLIRKMSVTFTFETMLSYYEGRISDNGFQRETKHETCFAGFWSFLGFITTKSDQSGCGWVSEQSN